MLKSLGLDRMSTGIYTLSSPSFIEVPRAVHHAPGIYEYVISEDDHPDKDFAWVLETLRRILHAQRMFPSYRVLVNFHLFDLAGKLSKTPRYGALLVDPETREATQYMFTRRNVEEFNIKFGTLDSLVDALTDTIGWHHDRK